MIDRLEEWTNRISARTNAKSFIWEETHDTSWTYWYTGREQLCGKGLGF